MTGAIVDVGVVRRAAVETGTADVLLRRRGEFYHLSASQLQEEQG
ncbi:MAG: hypothetical protein QME70_01585 [Bacillota bacterium]|nr:hypothetical protein [Bacillota bacterium]